MRQVAGKTLARTNVLLVSLLALAHAPGSGISGLKAQETERVPDHHVRADTMSPALDSLFDEFRETIRDSMTVHDVPGLSIAVVDRDRLLWSAGFGVRDRATGKPVTPETVFSVQSISKLFTGVAAMLAVEDGLLKLDAPVTAYLPDFTVNSRFSEGPAPRMTVRHLLTHAAGFTHEAPVGNNYDAFSPSMEAHVRSIRDTWLKFPVGTDHAYSNLGVDLAGYILQEQSGRAYQDYVDEEILNPLGMDASFVDTAGQKLCSNCAAGHREGFASLPEYVPMTASGGVRVSAEDAGRFLQFLLRFGETPDGDRILEASSFDELYRPTGRLGDGGWPHVWFGIGVMVHAHEGGRNPIHTNGGGFGYISSMRWYPEHGVGAVVLTNSDHHHQFGDDLTDSVLDSIVARGLAPTAEGRDVPTVRSFFTGLPDTPAAAPEAVRSEPTPYRPEWDGHPGTYEVVYGGGFELAPSADRADRRAEVLRKDGYLQLRHPGSEEPEPLIEHESGLFFGANSGEALDLRGDPPTWRNIELEKVEEVGMAAAPGTDPGPGGTQADTVDLDLEACEVPGLERSARCGTLTVPEDRESPDGRRIGLRLVVVPARERPAEPDPVFFLSGGPGQAATADAASEASSPLGRRRDMVFVDQRGTGGSSPLRCDLGGLQAAAETYLARRVPRERLERCREGLAADPRHYWTGPAVKDLDDVRAALGYEAINLKGGSYGTRVALVYARRHPEHTRALLLSGVAPMSYRLPLPHPRESQRALDSLAAACEAVRSCQESYGKVGKLLERVEAALERRPRTVPVAGPPLPDSARITLDPGILRGAVHLSLYDVGTAARLPALLAAADRGDYRPLASWAARLTTLFDRALYVGMAFSVICAEDVPRISPSEVGPETEGTYLGGQYVRGLISACKVWPAAEVKNDYFEPVTTEAPTLMISGAVDPVTPPHWAERLGRRLPNARHLVVPNRAHTPGLPQCAEEFPVRFLDRLSAEDLDASCLEKVERPAFEDDGSD